MKGESLATSAYKPNLILLHEVSKDFEDAQGQKVCALNKLDLRLEAHGITMLVGPDGAGKTTFMRLCAGLMAPSSGEMTVLGLKVGPQSTRIQNIVSYMPQKFGLYEDLTVAENLQLYANLYGLKQDVFKTRAQELLAMTGLSAFTKRLAGKLSGGMKQKLGLACTMSAQAKLLILDEPCVGVDPLSRQDLWRIIIDLVRTQGTSVLVSTAYLDDAVFADRVLIFAQGEIFCATTPSELAAQAQGCAYELAPPINLPSRVWQAELLELKHVTDALPVAGRINITLAPNTTAQDLVHEVQALKARPETVLKTKLSPSFLTMIKREPTVEDGFMALFRAKNGSALKLAQTLTKTRGTGVTGGLDYLDPLVNGNSEHPLEPEVIIEVKDLVKNFGDFVAVNHTSFEVKRGEIFGLLGPNGAGKTTTFRMLCGLIPASGGTLQVAGFDLRKARNEARRHIGYVAQKFSLYQDLSVLENLNFFGGVYGLRGAKLKERIDEVMQEFDLTARKDDKSIDLPLGYKQRLSMAVGTIHEPDILFLDEPTSGIDPFARRVFWHRITKIAQNGTTIIVTTHFLDEAEYCDRIMIQDAGTMIALGTPQEVRAQGGSTAKEPLSMEQVFINIVLQARGGHA